MRWPLVWRSTYEQLQKELEAERARARRRERRGPKTEAFSGPPLKPSEFANGLDDRARLAEMTAFADYPELPAIVVNAIEARAGGLTSRAASVMMKAAQKSLAAGTDPERVANWMWEGDQ